MIKFIHLFNINEFEEKEIFKWLNIIELFDLLEETQKGIFEFHPSYYETWFNYFIDQFYNRIILFLLEETGKKFYIETRNIEKYLSDNYYYEKKEFIETFIEYFYDKFLFKNYFKDFFNYNLNFENKNKKDILDNFYKKYKDLFFKEF